MLILPRFAGGTTFSKPERKSGLAADVFGVGGGVCFGDGVDLIVALVGVTLVAGGDDDSGVVGAIWGIGDLDRADAASVVVSGLTPFFCCNSSACCCKARR